MSNRRIEKNSGFTLFEVLIYIALFTVIVGGGVLSALSIFEGTARMDLKTREETELNFTLRKLDWALSGGTILEPGPGDTSSFLRVDKGPTYRFFTDADGNFWVNDGADNFQLTNTLSIDSLEFTHTAGTPTRSRYSTASGSK